MMNRTKEWLHHATPLISLLAAMTILAVFLQTRPQSTPELPAPSLKELAKQKNIDLGNFAIPKRLNEKPYRDILTRQFNLALIDNQPNWAFTDTDLRPSPTSYNFSRIDEVVNFAEKHNMKMQAHHFLWGEEKWLPGWLKNGNYTKPQLMNLIHDHIAKVGGRYKGHITEWTVVNEAFTRQQHIFGLRDWWADATGDHEYIDQAFIWAREADPDAILILNDFHNESINDISNDMYDYIKAAKARGIPIDSIGMQMHIDGTHPPMKDEVVSNMRRFGELGVKVHVTEFDVNMNDVKADRPEKDLIEGDIYYEMLRACIESGVCSSFAILGITDKETWYTYMGLPDARPLPFNEQYEPKPAYWGLRRALEE